LFLYNLFSNEKQTSLPNKFQFACLRSSNKRESSSTFKIDTAKDGTTHVRSSNLVNVISFHSKLMPEKQYIIVMWSRGGSILIYRYRIGTLDIRFFDISISYRWQVKYWQFLDIVSSFLRFSNVNLKVDNYMSKIMWYVVTPRYISTSPKRKLRNNTEVIAGDNEICVCE